MKTFLFIFLALINSLIFPQEDVESMRISFSDMNELMEKREKNGKQLFLHDN